MICDNAKFITENKDGIKVYVCEGHLLTYHGEIKKDEKDHKLFLVNRVEG